MKKATKRYVRIPGVIAEPDMNILKAHKNDLCIELLNVAKKQNMVDHHVNKFRNNPLLAEFFSKEELTGLLHITISQVLCKFEDFLKNKKSRKKQTLDFTLFGTLRGYFTNAYINNVAKLYTKHKTDKRSAKKGEISFDNNWNNENPVNQEVMMSHSYDPNKDEDYKSIISSFISHLRLADKQINLVHQQKGSSDKRYSKMARIFVALLSPRYTSDQEEVRKKLNLSAHIFKMQKKEMLENLRSTFPEDALEALNLVLNRDKIIISEPKESKSSAAPEFRVNTCFSMKNKKSKVAGKAPLKEYTQRIFVEELKGGSWVLIKEKNRKIVDRDNSISYDEAKEKLKIMTQKDLIQLKRWAAR